MEAYNSGLEAPIWTCRGSFTFLMFSALIWDQEVHDFVHPTLRKSHLKRANWTNKMMIFRKTKLLTLTHWQFNKYTLSLFLGIHLKFDAFILSIPQFINFKYLETTLKQYECISREHIFYHLKYLNIVKFCVQLALFKCDFLRVEWTK